MIDIVPDSLEIVYFEDMCFFLFFKEYLFSFVNEIVAYHSQNACSTQESFVDQGRNGLIRFDTVIIFLELISRLWS